MTTLTNIRFHMVTPERSISHEKPCWLGRIAMGAVFVGWAVLECNLNGLL